MLSQPEKKRYKNIQIYYSINLPRLCTMKSNRFILKNPSILTNTSAQADSLLYILGVSSWFNC